MGYVWCWIHSDPSRRISDGGDSDSHRLRIGHGAVDIPSWPAPNTEVPAGGLVPYGVTARVDFVGTLPECGNVCDFWFVWRDSHWWVRTCHWAEVTILAGSTFHAGNILGVMGKSGLPATSGRHQHVAMKRDNAWVDPEDFIFERTEEDAMPTLSEEEKAEALALLDITYGTGRMLCSEQTMPDTLASVGQQVKQAAIRLRELMGLG